MFGEEIGHFKRRHDETEFEWKINDFFSVAENKRTLKCPPFSFLNSSWHFILCLKSIAKPGFVNLYLMQLENFECSVEYYFGLKKLDGSMENLTKGTLTVKSENTEFNGMIYRRTDSLFFKLSEVQKRKSELAPADAIIVTCTLKRVKTRSQRTNLLKPRKRQKLMSEQSLHQDYKKMFLDGQNHDLILKVADKEFPVHRDILRARSHVFESMLNHDMKEKNSGVIDVPDCDSKSMKEFLLYIYCGEVETLDENNVIGLYYLADKYDIRALKEECCEFLKESVSLSNVCEVIQLALNHSDSNLLEYATEYFCSNSHNILLTVEWKSFMKDNSTVANELLITAINALRNTKN